METSMSRILASLAVAATLLTGIATANADPISCYGVWGARK